MRDAYRVCLALGIDDPEFWYQTIQATRPDVLTKWIAYYELEPWGDEWRQAGTIASEVNYLASLHAAAGGIKTSIRTPASFLPVVTDEEQTIGSGSRRRLTDEEAHYSFLVGFGFL